MMGVFKASWKARTGVHASRAESAKHGAREEWIRTRAVILQVVGRFPEVIGAVRDALEAVHRPCPEELYEPG